MKFKELTFINNYIFAKVLQHNKRLCKRLIEIIIGKKIKEIHYIEAEKTINPSYDSKGIRLDVCVIDDEGKVYDLEMQVIDTKNIKARVRYYHGVIGSDRLKKGKDYINISDVTVIFICLEDVLGHNEPFYNIVKVANGYYSSYEYEDGENTIIFNAACTRLPDDEIGRFLKFLKTNIPTDDFTEELLHEVEIVKLNKEWEAEYMTLESMFDDKIRLGDAKRLVKAVESLMKKKQFSLEDACDAIDVTVDEYSYALDLVKKNE